MAATQDAFDSIHWDTSPSAQALPPHETAFTSVYGDLGNANAVSPQPNSFSQSPQSAVRETPIPTAAAVLPPAAVTATPASALHSFTMQQSDLLSIIICNPQKHGEGLKDAHISYEIHTKTMLETFASPELRVRRRYRDFVWLQLQLESDFPACILPPLPDKHRLEYLDRFSAEFIERRRIQLQRFVDRIAAHPLLQKSDTLRNFLEKEYLVTDAPKKESVLENLSDALVNAFSKGHKLDPRFVDLKTLISKFDDHLHSIDKIQARLAKHQTDLAAEMLEYVPSYSNLAHMEPDLHDAFLKLANVHESISNLTKETTNEIDLHCHSIIREFIQYARNAKHVLKARDQRQIDFEDLSLFLKQHQEERDKIVRTGDANAGSGAVMGYLTRKMDDLRGVDNERARVVKLARLESKINELQKASVSSDATSQAFNEATLREFDLFETMKKQDLEHYLKSYARTERDFHRKALDAWLAVIPALEEAQVDL